MGPYWYSNTTDVHLCCSREEERRWDEKRENEKGEQWERSKEQTGGESLSFNRNLSSNTHSLILPKQGEIRFWTDLKRRALTEQFHQLEYCRRRLDSLIENDPTFHRFAPGQSPHRLPIGDDSPYYIREIWSITEHHLARLIRLLQIDPPEILALLPRGLARDLSVFIQARDLSAMRRYLLNRLG
jgi:hypothetical protein